MSRFRFDSDSAVPYTAIAAAVMLMTGCAQKAMRNPDAERVRNDLTAIQSDPNLAGRSPLALKEAEQAVIAAEVPDRDSTLTAHRVYVADRKVRTTKALSESQYHIELRKSLGNQADQARLDSRTREADMAKNRNADLLSELAALKAKDTDRGIEINLGDVLFTSGRADLKPGGAANLDKLVTALEGSSGRNVLIEGYTDSQGADEMNMALSQKRADAVSRYITGHGVSPDRVSAIGKGEDYPVADNASAAGRQLNRRVVVTIQNPVRQQ